MPQPTWVTPAGNFGTFTEGAPITQTFVATPSTGGYTLEYTILNGTFPTALVPFTLNSTTGVFTGTADEVAQTTEYQFTIRVYQYNGLIQEGFTDRTFSFSVQGVSPPSFVTPAGALYPGPTFLPDSTWNPFQIVVNNPDPNTEALIRLIGGSLPDGLEINNAGLIRGYANPSNTNYNFTLQVESESGTATRNFSIQIVQQTPLTRAPAILNTQPPSYNIPFNSADAPYYVNSTGNLGVISQDNYFIFKILGTTFGSDPVSYIRTGSLPPGLSDNIDYRPDNVTINVNVGGSGYAPGDQLLVPGNLLGGVLGVNDMYMTVLTVDSGAIDTVQIDGGLNVDSLAQYDGVPITTVTGAGAGAIFRINKISAGYILGTVAINPLITVATYNFTYEAVNTVNLLSSPPISFTLTTVSQTDNVPFDTTVNWITSADLGIIYNSTISSLNVEAVNVGGLPLEYTLVSGSLPPDLTLQNDGTITGKVAWETQASVAQQDDTFAYTFTVTAANLTYPEITSTKTFTLTVQQKFAQPYDSLYIRSYLDIGDRLLLESLLEDNSLIPQEYLYRALDPYFGKATDVVYQHMYGVPSSTVDTYLTAVQKNYYRRNLILGPIKTAEARDTNGVVKYEVVYSEIVDNLVNDDGVSISKQITWPFPIEGSSRTLYPNSLPNMRQQIADVIGQDTQSALLPLWMSCQQENGGILGFVPAWVICYTKPGYSKIIKNNIQSPFPDQITVIASSAIDNTFEVASTAGFYPGMRIKFSGAGFGGITIGVQYYIYSITSEKQFTITTSMYTGPITLSSGTGEMYMEHVDWGSTLNQLNFKIDRFEVDKTVTYDYDPGSLSWTTLPSGVDPTDSNDEYVLWKKNILSTS